MDCQQQSVWGDLLGINRRSGTRGRSEPLEATITVETNEWSRESDQIAIEYARG
jgi:hypothetical protein